jgi:hypothetical protein
MLMVGIHSRKDYPRTLIQLRGAKLSKLDQLKRDGLKKKYSSLQAAFTHAPVYMAGWLFLGAVTVWGGFRHLR